jgi:hypothetical protein
MRRESAACDFSVEPLNRSLWLHTMQEVPRKVVDTMGRKRSQAGAAQIGHTGKATEHIGEFLIRTNLEEVAKVRGNLLRVAQEGLIFRETEPSGTLSRKIPLDGVLDELAGVLQG